MWFHQLSGDACRLDNTVELSETPRRPLKTTEAVFFVLQSWLDNVTDEDIYDEVRFKSDSIYARHFANMNIFSCLIKHSEPLNVFEK